MPEVMQEPAVPERRVPRIGVLAGVAVLVVALDAISKALVVANLTPGEPVHVLGNVLEWTLLRNPGAAFSVGTGYTAVFTVLAIGVIAFVVRTARRLRSTGYAVAFGLLLGGAGGNLGDRIFRAPGVFRGDVVDWIGVVPRYWPVFNLADSAICIAGALFVLLTLRGVHIDGTRGDQRVAERPGPDDSDSSSTSASQVSATPGDADR